MKNKKRKKKQKKVSDAAAGSVSPLSLKGGEGASSDDEMKPSPTKKHKTGKELPAPSEPSDIDFMRDLGWLKPHADLPLVGDGTAPLPEESSLKVVRVIEPKPPF